MKIFEIDFSEFSKHKYLRFDEKFWDISRILITKNFILLKNIYHLINGNSYTEFYTEEKTTIPYVRIGDLTFKYEIDDKNIIYLDDSINIPKDKILKRDDLILATIGATIGKINLIRNLEGGTFSNNTILLRLKDKTDHSPYFYEKLFQTSLMQKYIWGVISQKAQPNLQTYDLERIKIPLISKEEQDKIVAKIAPIENKIKELKSSIKQPQKIINKIFAREFKFDLERFEEVKKEKFFDTEFKKINEDQLLIIKAKFHKYNLNYINKINTTKLKTITEFIKSGNAEKYENVEEEGNYISVEDFKSNGNIKSSKYTKSKNKILKNMTYYLVE
jgi:type I restriction enzyme S subunit